MLQRPTMPRVTRCGVAELFAN